jgi:opacity protein-like surface antigen
MKRVFLLFVCLLFAVPSFAITGISLGVKGGMVSNYEQSGLSVGNFETDKMNLVGAQIRISTFPVLDLILSGDYAWKNKEYDFSGQSFELKMHDLSFNASLVYPIKFKVVSPYLGGGLGTHHLSFDYLKPLSLSLAESDITVPASENRMGYHLVGGLNIGLPAFPFGINGEFRMNWIDTPGQVTKYNSISVGLSYNLP